MPRTPATPAQPGDITHNPAKKSPRRSNSSKTPNKTTVYSSTPRAVLPVFECGEECSCTADAQLSAALVDLQSFYDRIDRGDTSWSGADAQRLAEIRKTFKFTPEERMRMNISGWVVYVAAFIFLVALTSPAKCQTNPAAIPPRAKADSLPTLKPDVELVLTKLQRDLSLLLLQETQLQNQFTQMEKQKPALQAELQSKTASALKDSGIDEKLYELDPNTLQVKQRTTPAPAAAPPAKPDAAK